MAVDTARIVADLLAFYDFSAKAVLAVGAGGGQLAEYGRRARQVVAVDCDAAAVTALARRVRALGLEDRFTLRHSELLAVEDPADVVLFELSLHEMPDPGLALDHALGLAPEVVVLEHSPGSPWAYQVLEEDKVELAWRAVHQRRPSRARHHRLEHRFATHRELLDKVRSQGEEAVRRAERFRGLTDIAIPVGYGLALLG
jgi:protein-L-isoaspartate O-methyltransferase